MKAGRLAAQIAIVLLICSLGVFLFVMPRFFRPTRASEASLSAGALSADRVREALSAVVDPELGLNIVELGLVRDVRVHPEGKVAVTMILTSPFCPLEGYLLKQAKESVARLEGVREVEVKVDRDLIWSPEMASKEARRKLGGRLR